MAGVRRGACVDSNFGGGTRERGHSNPYAATLQAYSFNASLSIFLDTINFNSAIRAPGIIPKGWHAESSGVGMNRGRIKRLASADQPGGALVAGSRQGLEKVIEIQLTAEEKSALDRSAASVRELVSKLKV